MSSQTTFAGSRCNSFRLLALGALFGVLLATPAARAQAPYCTNATMDGTYVVQVTGTIITPTGNVPITGVGKVTYNGDGKGVSTISTSSFGGAISRSATPVPAVYNVNPDCTGSKIFGGAQHFDFVISPNGRLITFIVTDPGVVISGTAVRLDNKD